MNIDDNPFVINSSMKINHVHLKVSNLSESVNFYKKILGFRILKEDLYGNTTYLTPGPHYKDKDQILDPQSSLIILTQLEDNLYDPNYLGKVKREAGLYHFAILLPERECLAAFLRHIKENLEPKYYEGMADHAVSESIYIHDPDGMGIEIYRDRSPSEWIWNNNKVHMVTEPLNVTGLLSRYDSKTWNGMPVGTMIGHVHLHVSNLKKLKISIMVYLVCITLPLILVLISLLLIDIIII
ncbi:VOC family protein [Candidatus Nitrosocosmicus sp. T]